jgi:predicted Rossmann-fold nucleotide-binding protein
VGWARARDAQAPHFEHSGTMVLAHAAKVADRERNDYSEMMPDVGPQSQGPRSVLVAGTGQYNLPEPVQWISTAIARMLAASGCMLIVGGYDGVDHIVAREFVAALRARGLSLRGRILQVGRALGETDFYDPEVEQVPGGAAEYELQVTSADAAILIGGVGGVYETFERAARRGVAMIPLPASGGDALKAFNDLSRGDLAVPAAIREHLATLDTPVTSPQEATMLAGRVRDLLLSLPRNRAPERPSKEEAPPL